MNSGPFPELLTSRVDRPGAMRWEVDRGAARRGEAWTDLCRRVMRVPFGAGSHGRLVRAHELMHARVSPLCEDPFGRWSELDARAVECAEEFRVNQLLSRLGFELTELRDGSERLTGLRLADLGDLAEVVYFATAVSGTTALRDLLAGVRKVEPGWAATCRSLERSLRAAVRDIPTRSLAATAPADGALPEGFSVHTRRIATIVSDALAGRASLAPRRGRRSRPAPTGSFAPLVLDRTVLLDRHVPGARAPRKTPAAQGRRVVRPDRLVTDPSRRMFERRGRGTGGVVLVDQSGSMALTPDDMERLLAAAPGAFVLGYSHAPGSHGVPNAWVLAERGRAASTVRAGNVGNGVDGPALRFALGRRRPGERLVWVCDGQVTDSGDHADPGLAAECARLAIRHGVQMVATVDGALDALGCRGTREGTSRLLGRVKAAVTSSP